MQPLVSILIPAYSPQSFPQALASVNRPGETSTALFRKDAVAPLAEFAPRIPAELLA